MARKHALADLEPPFLSTPNSQMYYSSFNPCEIILQSFKLLLALAQGAYLVTHIRQYEIDGKVAWD